MIQKMQWLRITYNWILERTFILFWILLLINFISKILYLDAESMWLDEASTLNWALHSFKEIIIISINDPNGPVFQFILKSWISVFGISEFAIRLLPAIFGSIIIWPLYLLGRDLFNKEVGFIAILLFTVSNVFIFWSHEIRSYTLDVFLSSWSFYYFFKILRNGKKTDTLWYGLILTILLYTHLTSAMVLVVQFFASLFYFKSKLRNVLYTYAGMAAATFLFGIWFLNNNWIGGKETIWSKIPDFYSIIELLGVYFNSNNTLYFIGFIILAFVLAILLFREKLPKGKELIIFALWGLLPIAITFVGSIYYNPRFLPKYMIYAVPGLYLSVSVLIISISKKNIVKVLFTVVLIALMSAEIDLKPEKSEMWRDAISFHDKYKDANTFTVICAHYQSIPFSYYYNIEIFKDYENIADRLHEENIFLMCSLNAVEEAFYYETWANRMILILSHDIMFDPNEKLLNHMLKEYVLVDKKTNLRGIRIFVFDLAHTPQKDTPNIDIDSVPINATVYGNIYIRRLREIDVVSPEKVKFSCVVKSPEILEEAYLIISTRGENTDNLRYEISLNELVPGEPYKISKEFVLPDKYSVDSDIAIYIWQPNIKKKFVVEEVKIVVE
ncbi:MAG: glycosyltransferase family 39 protein [Bacteroidota bacterium]|nr:glycosyltransferase family 39 protein [Bacteroidota bacterium]